MNNGMRCMSFYILPGIFLYPCISDVTCASRRFKSPAIRLFVQQLIRLTIKTLVLPPMDHRVPPTITLRLGVLCQHSGLVQFLSIAAKYCHILCSKFRVN